ncbi:hypothetical protein [Lactobacillus mulieris]|uniref:Helix-turn-helix domain-containing protein n=1 Tax=Lactobacillus mulieris TaxID=2508708 RepID=A0AAW5X063_9LACO|nr:hypothetical protein [Lactobacillus mulieris]MCZ3622825.1 hypothetical protein [Lactobacillus mulieris]MCZ3624505.1 hypothetical protein [Lactobacillus mulieris]MCZ3636834.1 hypothetical protein [Lactobacillus mulieris]MCZ3690750.1 hypothetical protein [Lactobacillus mulieris]MCZ3696733.1 hypothetical protein [Lactobacillus mulieris]
MLRLNKKQLALEMGISEATLWRTITKCKKIAKLKKLSKCPEHYLYAGSRKYYYAEEIEKWIQEVTEFDA